MKAFSRQFFSILLAGIIVAGCISENDEKVPESTPSPKEVYARQLSEMEEPEGMLEKEKFFAKKAYMEEQSGLVEDAIESLEKAIQLNPSLPQYHFRLARLCLEVEKVEMARENAENALRLGLESDELIIFLTKIYLEQKDYEKGIFLLKDLFIDFPNSPELLSLRGQLHLGVGDTTNGIEDLRLSARNGEQKSWLVLSSLYVQKEPEAALEILDNFSEDTDDSYWLKGQAYAFLGNYDTARFFMSRIEIPSDDQLLFLPRLHQDSGNIVLAIREYNNILEMDSTNETARKELSELERNIAYLQSRRRVVYNDTLTSEVKKDTVRNNE